MRLEYHLKFGTRMRTVINPEVLVGTSVDIGKKAYRSNKEKESMLRKEQEERIGEWMESLADHPWLLAGAVFYGEFCSNLTIKGVCYRMAKRMEERLEPKEFSKLGTIYRKDFMGKALNDVPLANKVMEEAATFIMHTRKEKPLIPLIVLMGEHFGDPLRMLKVSLDTITVNTIKRSGSNSLFL